MEEPVESSLLDRLLEAATPDASSSPAFSSTAINYFEDSDISSHDIEITLQRPQV